MSVITKSKIINISSLNSNKKNGSFNSSVVITLPSLFSKHDDTITNVNFSVLHAEIPNSFYLINYSNNTLIINSVTYTIPFGNYNASTLITALKTILPSTFTITYSSTTLKYTFTNSTAFVISKNSTILKIIGGDTTTDSSSSTSYTTPYTVNFLPIPRINFRTSAFNFDNFNSSDSSSDVFLSVQNNGLLGTMILYTNNSGLKNIINIEHFSNILDIKVTDDDGVLIDFNNANWYMTIQIDIQYIQKPKISTFSNIITNS